MLEINSKVPVPTSSPRLHYSLLLRESHLFPSLPNQHHRPSSSYLLDNTAIMSSSSTLLRFLTTNQIIRLCETHVTRASPTQLPLLDSAVSSPQNHKYYGQNDVFQLAGILAEKIILNHAYQDGNKRVALVAADMFLKINGYQLQKKPFGRDEVNDSLKDAHVAVATNVWTAEDLAEYYRSIAKPVNRVTSEVQRYTSEAEQM